MSDWIRKRGVLYALTQTPILALLVGFFLRIAPYPLMLMAVLFSFVTLPLWVAHRKAVSDDPSEPVHHLTKFALWALLPVPIFSLVRIPTHFWFGMAFWHPWYDFGSSLTGLPINQFSSLVPGALLYSLQGYSLTLGFYILFQRHTLLNAILYICVFDTSIYSFIFPAFARVGMPSPPRWHAVAWIAHFIMAGSVWFSPKLWSERWPKFGQAARTVTLAAAALIVLTPYGFAFYRAAVWQFPAQRRIDQGLFSRLDLLKLASGPTLVRSGDEAEYEIGFVFGPRKYKNYVGRQKQLDARDVSIEARLKDGGRAVAWCRAQYPSVPSANPFAEHDEKVYFQKLEELDSIRLNARCFGPVGLSSVVGSKLEVEWKVRMRLVGDREESVRLYESTSSRAPRELAGVSGN
jgi:hypothetical protein